MVPGKRRRYRLVRPRKKYRLIRRDVPPAAASGEVEVAATPDNPRVPFGKSRHELIAEAAFRRAERRGFSGGSAERDWYEAEAEIEELLRRSRGGPGEETVE